jgi:hypothetical protein
MTDRPRILRVGEEPPPMEPHPRRQGGSKAGEGKGSTPTAKAAAPGRFGLLNAFVDGATSRLSRADLAVWLVLFRDSRDGTAATAQSAIAQRAGCDVRTVRRALASLEKAGLVEVVVRSGLRRGPSRYRVCGAATAE